MAYIDPPKPRCLHRHINEVDEEKFEAEMRKIIKGLEDHEHIYVTGPVRFIGTIPKRRDRMIN